MEKLVFNFLDKYVGEGIKVRIIEVPALDPLSNSWCLRDAHFVISYNRTLIMTLNQTRSGSFDPTYSKHLLEVMSLMFSTTNLQSKEYLIIWFCNKHNIKDYMQLLKFVV
jgi:hypothetical protein